MTEMDAGRAAKAYTQMLGDIALVASLKDLQRLRCDELLMEYETIQDAFDSGDRRVDDLKRWGQRIDDLYHSIGRNAEIYVKALRGE